MKKKAVRRKNFKTMTTSSLAEATAAYDHEMVIDDFKPPTGAAAKRWSQARRKPGRPRRGQGAKVISVSVERGLLSRSDTLAKDLGLSRAAVVERGLKAVLAAEGRL
jgi:hypothetical protein